MAGTALVWAMVLADASAVRAQDAALRQKATDFTAISSTLDSTGHAAIIVEFESPTPRSEFRNDPDFLASLKARIAAQQAAIINTHFGSVATPRAGVGFNRSLQLMSISPMFAINATRAEIDALAADGRVVRIHPNRLDTIRLIQSVPLVGMTGAGGYSSGASGNGQAVAILDTGLQTNHEFVSGRVVAEACFSNGGSGGTTLCPNGLTSQTGTGSSSVDVASCIVGSTQLCDHGTHVAGIAAGYNTSSNAGEPSNGVAKNAKIVAVQVFTRFTGPDDVRAYVSDQILGLEWVAANAVNLANGVKLAAVNMSLGGGNYTTYCDGDSRKTAIDALLALGVATVIASGNDYYTNGVGAPGCISSAVTVGSSTKSDGISSFSNMGTPVDIMAPGSSILSSIPTVPSSTTTYAIFNGTSMATPHVAGTFAAIRSVCPSKTVAEILSALQSTGVAISDSRSGGTLTRNRIRVGLAAQQLGCGSSVATHDFSAEQRSDILWKHSGGSVAMWLMNGGTVTSSLAVATVGAGWSVVGTRDFNGDGKSDILWQNGSTVAMWLMNSGAVSQSLSVASVGAGWSVVGTRDFNGDSKGDILWKHSGGGVALWLMNGATVSQSLTVGSVGTSWSVAGIADFNGDGKADILWKHDTGALAMWLMNGGTVLQSLAVGSVGTGWSVAGTGDFDGDGRGDILWRNSSHVIAMWLMNGATVTQSAAVATVDGNWTMEQTGDINGDGRSDLLWRHTSGVLAAWFMNGASVASSAGISTIDGNWVVQKANSM
ncbi:MULTISPECIES: S8 family serine peptidase [Rhodoplanes]|nr:S8 family serine peptidase [Rhodoplanes serenus]